MTVDQAVHKVRDALKLTRMRSRLPRNPRVVEIRVEDYVDMDKEDALRVTIVIHEDVDVEKTSYEDLSDLVEAVRGRVRELGVDLWPYIFFAKPSELEEEQDEE